MNNSNEVYIKAFKGWLRKQDISKERNIQDVKLIKEQIILDDEVTKSAIINFNLWAKEEKEEEIIRESTILKGITVKLDFNLEQYTKDFEAFKEKATKEFKEKNEIYFKKIYDENGNLKIGFETSKERNSFVSLLDDYMKNAVDKLSRSIRNIK